MFFSPLTQLRHKKTSKTLGTHPSSRIDNHSPNGISKFLGRNLKNMGSQLLGCPASWPLPHTESPKFWAPKTHWAAGQVCSNPYWGPGSKPKLGVKGCWELGRIILGSKTMVGYGWAVVGLSPFVFSPNVGPIVLRFWVSLPSGWQHVIWQE
jgi:hypothetical protein